MIFMISNSSWQIKERIEKYKNPWMEVFEDQVIRPDGKLEGTDIITKIVKMKLEDAVSKVGSEITHASSCVLILKSYFYLKERGDLS